MKRGKSRGVGARAAFGSADDLNKETKSGAFNQLPSPQPQAQPSSDVRSTTTQPHPLTPLVTQRLSFPLPMSIHTIISQVTRSEWPLEGITGPVYHRFNIVSKRKTESKCNCDSRCNQ